MFHLGSQTSIAPPGTNQLPVLLGSVSSNPTCTALLAKFLHLHLPKGLQNAITVCILSSNLDHASLLSHCQLLSSETWQGLSPQNLAILAHLLSHYFSYLAEQFLVDQAVKSASTGIANP